VGRLLTSPGDYLALEGVGWSTYRAIGRLLEGHNVRLTYLDGRLEIVSPSAAHEQAKEKFAIIIRLLARALDVPLTGFGSTTFRRRRKRAGKEPDTCFYLGDRAAQMWGKIRVNLRIDPAPDVAVEVVITARDTVALATYRRLGVPEVWWFEDDELTFHRLGADGRYAEVPESVAFPSLRPDVVEDWISTPAMHESEWTRRVEGPIAVEATRLRAGP
jgi:Uma2 family endonuclease